MYLIDNVVIEAPCPNCGFFNPCTMKQVRLRDVVICRGCKANVQLDDRMNECRKAAKEVDRAMSDFDASLKMIFG